MGILEDDKKARNRIVSETKTNFFVEAGAGSGKTTMLVNRMVAMVEADIDISKIAAITFTKAAAGEFYERFQKILIERSNPDYKWIDEGKAGQLPKPTEETRQHCADALKKIDLCFMGTIDSFCNLLLTEHPTEAGILSDSSIVTDDEAKVIYRRVYVDVCNGVHGEDLKQLAESFRAVHGDDQAAFITGIELFIKHRNVHFNYSNSAPIDIDKDYAVYRKDLIKAVKCMREHKEEIAYPKDKGNQEAWNNIDDIYYAVRTRWSSNLSGVLYRLGQLAKIRLNEGAMDSYGPELSSFFEFYKSTVKYWKCTIGDENAALPKLRKYQYNTSVDFLLKCVDIIEKEMHDSGILTFFDGLYYLRNMLKRDAESGGKLINYIYRKHSYYLIDEFQDTDPMQAEVFFYLAAENPVAKWYECKPRAGSLFIVGDPKQSIYRFRGADVTSYLRVQNLFAADEKLKLTQNFRSKRALIYYFNTVFPEMLQDDPIAHNQSAFEPIPLPENSDECCGVYRYVTHEPKDEPNDIVAIINQLVNNPNYLIRGKDDPKDEEGKVPLRPIRYSDIMVITYNKDHLKEIMPVFTENNIPMKVEGQVLFKTNEAFLELFSIYAAIVDNDAVALYAALTGKHFALTNHDLMIYRSCGGKLSLNDEFDNEGCRKKAAKSVAAALEELKRLRDNTRAMSPAALLAYLLDECKIYLFDNTDNMEVVYYALELVRNSEVSGVITSLRDGKYFLEELQSDDSEVERCLNLGEKEDRVRMANLHKIKGLEAPVVILSKAQKNTNLSGSFRIERAEDSDSVEGYLISLKQKDSRIPVFQTNEYDGEGGKKEQETIALKAEEDRKVYVAATRARNLLIINEYRGGSNIWCKLINDEMVGYFFSEFTLPANEIQPGLPAKAEVLFAKAEEEQVLKHGNRSSEEKSYTSLTPSKLELISKTEEADSEGSAKAIVSNPTDEAAELRAFADIMGTMVHKFMEVLVSSKGRIDCNNVITEIISEHRTQQMIPYEAKVRASLEKIAATIANGGYPQPNGLPQDILKTLLAAEDVRCEVPFCYRDETPEGTVIWNGIIDVMYCEGGKWHIVDYKTNADGEDLDTKYQNQLSAYVKAFKETTGNEADARIYHIEL